MLHLYQPFLVYLVEHRKFWRSLNWLPDVVETQAQVTGYLEVAYNLELKEQVKGLTKNIRKVKESTRD